MYHNFRSNSTIQVNQFANNLAHIGHSCAICIPDDKNSAKNLTNKISYNIITYQESLTNNLSFFNNCKPDIIHVWTPREIVRKQYTKLKERFPDCKLVIHLEDNEEHILEKSLKIPFCELIKKNNTELDNLIVDSLSHPIYYKEFISNADAVTYIIDNLSDFIDKSQKSMLLWPIIDYKYFVRMNNRSFRKKHNIPDNEIVITYTGNVHYANYKEVRSLYLAVAIANRENIPCRLIRTGCDYVNFLGEQDQWAHENSIELGFVNYELIPEILNAADLLIQPGNADEFNNYRLPSKIPEFLATSIPVIIPNSNIAYYLKDQFNAVLLKKGDAIEIFNMIKDFKNNPHKFLSIGKQGQLFCIENFNNNKITSELAKLYTSLL
jgi:hypothetical protein